MFMTFFSVCGKEYKPKKIEYKEKTKV